MKRLLLLLAALTALLVAPTQASHGAEPEALAAMRRTVKGLTTYQVEIESHQVLRSKREDLTIRLSYRAPGWVRTDVLQGKNRNAIAVYDPGAKRIRAKLPASPVVAMSPDAKMALSLRGERIHEASFPSMLARADRYLAHAPATSGGQKTVEGRLCDIVVFTVPGATEPGEVATERWAIDVATHLPVMMAQRDAQDGVLATSTYRAFVPNPTFPDDQFAPFPRDAK